MATIEELCEIGEIEHINVLEDDTMPDRFLYGTKEFIKWLDNPEQGSGLGGIVHTSEHDSLTPREQLFAWFDDYSSGKNMSSDNLFKKLHYSPDYFVWEIKTTHVRVFGWVPKRGSFICCFGDDSDRVKFFPLYSWYIVRTEFVRNNMRLDHPKSVSSGEYGDVL